MAFLPLDGPLGDCEPRPMHTEILLFDGFDELDVFGPFEVLASVGARLVTLDGAREVRSDRGIVVRAQAALSDAPDVLVVPGGGWLDRAPQGAYAEVQRGVLPSAV